MCGMKNPLIGPQDTAGLHIVSRRAVLKAGSLLLTGAAGTAITGCAGLHGDADHPRKPVRIGLVTDVHYADKEAKGTRHYRDSLAKLSSAVQRFNEAKVDFIVELGDLIDSANTAEEELGYLKHIESVFARAQCPRYHVLGNHCVYSLTKQQFLAECSALQSYFSFDRSGWHFVLLDGCFRGDGEPYGSKNFKWTDARIPPAELDWLERDLAGARKQTIVFIHQRLDVDNHYAVSNSPQVRQLLEDSGVVKTVIQGHNHRNDLQTINGIAYCTLTAMVDGPVATDNAYGLLELREDGAILLQGFGRQASARLTAV